MQRAYGLTVVIILGFISYAQILNYGLGTPKLGIAQGATVYILKFNINIATIVALHQRELET